MGYVLAFREKVQYCSDWSARVDPLQSYMYELNSTRTPKKMGHKNSPNSWPIELKLAVWFHHEHIKMLN